MSKSNLIKEEIKRYKSILEYSFYDDSDLDVPMNEDDDEVSDEEIDDMGNDIENDLNDDESESNGESEDVNLNDMGDGSDEDSEEEINLNDIEPEEPGDVDFESEDSDEVELDVTELVNGTDEAKMSADNAKASADEANAKMNDLMKMVNNLESKLDSMSTISNKIDLLGKEIVKRAPTPEEKINMRSLDSYPYNLKLNDFWKDDNGDGSAIKREPEEEEYVLTKDEINSTYSDSMAKQSLSNPYIEDEI